jgi:hypothetical protein
MGRWLSEPPTGDETPAPTLAIERDAWRYIETTTEDRALAFFGYTRDTGEVRRASVTEAPIVLDVRTIYAVRRRTPERR